jgi:RNA polymerase sigma-70 factor (ECF subfamily)
LRAWLFRVAHNEAMDCRRRSALEDRSIRAGGWWKSVSVSRPDELVGRREQIDRIRRAVESLPAEQRQVVQLRIYEELTFAEIAARLQAPLGTVLTRMRLATRKLTEALKSEIE